MKLVHFVWALPAIALAACSGSSSQSGQPPPGTLAGTVTGQTSLRVAVVGSSTSTSTDSSGAFTLAAAAGSSALRFTGSGIDATLSIAPVVPGEYRELVVGVSNGSAQEQLDRSSSEFSGAIAALASASIAVDGRTIRVGANTFVTDGDGTLSLGDLIGGETVTVEGALQSDGTMLARTIEVGSDDLTLVDGGCAMLGGPGAHDGDGDDRDGGGKGDMPDGGICGPGGSSGGSGAGAGGSAGPGGSSGPRGPGGHHGPGEMGPGYGGFADAGPMKGCGHRPPRGGGDGLAHAMGAIVSIDATSDSFVIGTTTIETNSATIYGGTLTFAALVVGEQVAVVGAPESAGSDTILAAAIQATP